MCSGRSPIATVTRMLPTAWRRPMPAGRAGRSRPAAASAAQGGSTEAGRRLRFLHPGDALEPFPPPATIELAEPLREGGGTILQRGELRTTAKARNRTPPSPSAHLAGRHGALEDSRWAPPAPSPALRLRSLRRNLSLDLSASVGVGMTMALMGSLLPVRRAARRARSPGAGHPGRLSLPGQPAGCVRRPHRSPVTPPVRPDARGWRAGCSSVSCSCPCPPCSPSSSSRTG